ncbi:hypothetical protein COHA_004285 [Chlorella ohadii]|uniref:Uncharacterized protein n=1 Tax=Chlorella ohadii TaxID=2649997 RepID=A0AAD5H6L4_9CHLO|nr:hypothetical protein COHA_004285 [Chlorella ohadii]
MGAGGSKAAAAQKAASRAAAAATRPPAAAAAAAGEAAAGISAAEREREAALRAQLAATAAEPADAAAQREAAERQHLVQSMQAVMAGVKQYQFEVYQNPETDKKYAVKKRSKEEKEAELVGRLTSPILRQLLEEHAWSVRQGKPLDAAAMARKYGAREDALAGVLQHNAMPIVYELPGGQMFGDWPRAPRAAAAAAAAAAQQPTQEQGQQEQAQQGQQQDEQEERQGQQDKQRRGS